MVDVNNQNLFNFLLLSVLVPSVGGEYANNIKEQKKCSMEPQRNNFGEPSKTVITVMPEDNTNFTGVHIKNQENATRTKNLEKGNATRQIRRSEANDQIRCLSCDAEVESKDTKCFSGETRNLVNCANGEECFTELHLQYIKRGCLARSRLNRTFICKCPLCNDKPFDDFASYEYKTIRDWEYDNKRLQTANLGIDLLCKVCETKGINQAADKNCMLGKNTEYMVCAQKQLCFTNIDYGAAFVSRGCVNMPVSNSMYYFCNQTICNNEFFKSPELAKRMKDKHVIWSDEMDLPRISKKSLVSKATTINVKSMVSNTSQLFYTFLKIFFIALFNKSLNCH